MSHDARRMSPVARRPSPVARRTSHVARRALLPYGGNHPRPPPNKYNASFGEKCVTNAYATFSVTFDDFGSTEIKDATCLCGSRCPISQGISGGEGSRRPTRPWCAFPQGISGGEGVSPPYRLVARLPTGTTARTEARPPTHLSDMAFF